MAEAADGMRIALNSLELAVQIAEPRPDGVRLSAQPAGRGLADRIIGYDRAGDALAWLPVD